MRQFMEDDLIQARNIEGKLTKSFPKVVIVRHAESVANTKGVSQGQSYDTDLSHLGKRQAKALAQRMRELGVRRIISSPLKRAYQTALEVGKVCDCTIEINDFLKETNHGEWEGKSKEWIKENYPHVYDLWMSRPSAASFPKGEAFVDTISRVEIFLSSFRLTDDTLIVTHDNIVRTITCFANGQNMDALWKYQIGPASLNVFEIIYSSNVVRLRPVFINDDKHLNGLASDISTHAL